MSGDDLIPPSPRYDAGDAGPDDSGFFAQSDPIALFADWLKLASASEPGDANAMALATADALGAPDVRMVLLKGFDGRGFDFYTNEHSAKGEQLAANARAAICLHWKSLNWQVRARGPIEAATDAETDAYFATRDAGARRAAWASEQSREMPSRAEFDRRIAEVTERYPGEDVPRPAHWRGYRLVPLEIEFWRNRAFRLHDRLQFFRAAPGAAWAKRRLYP